MNSAICPLIILSHSVSFLQHPRILDHWAVLYCFAKLIDNSSAALFTAFRSTSFKASGTGTKGGACQFDDSPNSIYLCKITCVPKDSNCDTPFPKILMIAILASCASSSSTKESVTTLTLKKEEHNACFHPYLTHDQNGLSKACNGSKCKGM
ncbi:hypothetical protein H5410_045628, partial [Solanum commersonii]